MTADTERLRGVTRPFLSVLSYPYERRLGQPWMVKSALMLATWAW